MKILSINPVVNPQTGWLQIFGLADDNKVYAWSYDLGGWVENSLHADQKLNQPASQAEAA